MFILFVVLAKLLAVKHSRYKSQFVSKDHLCRIVGLQLMRDQGTAAKGDESRESVSLKTATATGSPLFLGSESVALGHQFSSPVCRA